MADEQGAVRKKEREDGEEEDAVERHEQGLDEEQTEDQEQKQEQGQEEAQAQEESPQAEAAEQTASDEEADAAHARRASKSESRTPAAAAAPGGEEEEWPTSADSYVLEAEIGFGAFATVYRASCTRTPAAEDEEPRVEECAIKIIDLEELNVNWEETRREISIMRNLRHPNVVPVLQAFVEEEELWIVMPLLDGGSCANIIKEVHAKGIKDDAVLARILLETLRGLAYLHADGHIHRDLKASNILISGGGKVMIADFGVAGTLMEPGDRKNHRTTFTGTPCWMAPEVMEQRAYDYKADIWSFGITALELAYGRAPYAHYQPMKVLMLTLQEPPPTAAIYKDNSYKFSSKLASLIEKCLRKDPSKRPTAQKLMDHKFFRKAADDKRLVEFLIAPMPRLGHDARPIPRRKKERKDQSKRKPISVGSWVFNPSDLAAISAEAKANGEELPPAMAAAAAEAEASLGGAADQVDVPNTVLEHPPADGAEAAAGAEDQGQAQPASQQDVQDGGAAAQDQDQDGVRKVGRFTVS